MAINFVWMRYPETGGRQRFAERSVPAWEARGWERCEAPEPTPPRQDPRYVDLPAPAVKGEPPAPVEAPAVKRKSTPANPGKKEGVSRG